jgi:alpha,alpha-trehalose phosphorylase
VIAAEVGHLDLAYEYLAEAALMDIHDLNHNTADGVHIASLGGAVIAVIAGLGGTREFNNQITFRPRLPDGLDGITFNVSTRGARLRVQVRHEEATYEVRAGGPITIGHHGDDVEIAAGNPVTLEIPALPAVPPAPRQPAGCEPKVRRKRI